MPGHVPSFQDAIEKAKQNRFREILKVHVRDEVETRRVVFVNTEFRSLDFKYPEGPLAEPDFWQPVVFDGWSHRCKLCVPPWLEGSPDAVEWYLERTANGGEGVWEGALSKDSGTFNGMELSLCEHLAQMMEIEFTHHGAKHQLHGPKSEVLKERKQILGEAANPDGGEKSGLARYAMDFIRAHDFLKDAREEAYKLEGRFPPKTRKDLGEGESFSLSEAMERIIEGAYRAGRHAERGAAMERGIDHLAKEGKPHIDAQKGGGSRSDWTARVAELYRENPQLKPPELAEILRRECLIDYRGDFKHAQEIYIEGEDEPRTRKNFLNSLGYIRKRLGITKNQRRKKS